MLIVILVTTLMTPPLLRWRVAGLRVADAAVGDVEDDGDGEWDIAVVGDRIVLRGRPPTADTVPVALEVARLAPLATPDSTVVEWFGARSAATWTGGPPTRTGWSTCCVPAMPAACASSTSPACSTGRCPRSARRSPGDAPIPASSTRRASCSSRPCSGSPTKRAARRCSPPSSPTCARRVRRDAPSRWRRASTPRAAAQIVDAVHGSELLAGALANPDALGEASILQLAEHFGGADAVDAAHELAAAQLDEDDWRRKELDEIRDRLLTALSHPELQRRGGDARRHSPQATPSARSDRRPTSPVSGWRTASPTFLVSHDPAELARQASLVGVRPRRGVVRVVVDELAEPGMYRIDVSCRDRPGLLARLTDAIAGADLDVVAASLTTWPDGAVLDSFVVRGGTRPDPGRLTERMERRLQGKIDLASLADVDVTFDDSVFPWHTQCVVRGADRRGLLAAIAAAFDAAKVDVHAASVGSDVDDLVENRFQITDRHGRKLGERGRAGVLAAFGRAS